MEVLHPSTPSPGATPRIRTPKAPQYGYSDPYEPYTPRKSTRIAQRAADRTPSPQLSSRHFSEPQQTSFGSPKSSKKRMTSNLATPALSPQKKRMPPMESSRRLSGTLTAESAANAAVALGLASNPESRSSRASALAGAGMLITPAKTPQKPPTEQAKAKVGSIARTLFHNEDDADVMPSPRKMRTQNYTLDSFCNEEEADEPIQIYTDSHERIPEIDDSAENPFYVGQSTAVPEPPKRRSTRQTVTIPGEGKVSVDEAIRREDGMLIVFRGKKQFRKFSEIDESSSGKSEGLDDGEGGLESAVESSSRRPFTRSSIKPRLLFPTTKAGESKTVNEDEEAATDIEDHVLAGMEEDQPVTPADLVEHAPGTPDAPRFAPASPPTTARTTRSANKKVVESTPMKSKQPGKRSPFDGWRRTKNGSQSTGHKRPGDELAAASTKRTKA
ncbi:hypothetical protein N656DRAFT_782537 [Canariomyces notabilis]|uniref:Uncharacterized protein n=1 Tax=Canariomyces notabilis TaxID=2074819 RepID=A0AAN6T922_9PEZI|nr:hypothetical protein N656DRAFT_782537 [Canariomyces arenarius]